MKFAAWLLPLACAISLAACSTEQLNRIHQDQQAKVEAERQRDQERQNVEDERQRLERQQYEAKQLKEKYDRYTTQELKIMYERYLDFVSGRGRQSDSNIRRNAFVPSEIDKKHMEQVIEIERELLRRWKSGDQDAHLAAFDPH
jgi:hypothetical protein